MRKKWFLINPPTGNYIRDTRCQASVDDAFAITPRSPVDLAYIAGAIEKSGDSCYIRDYPVEGLTWSDMLIDFVNMQMDYLLVNTTIYTYENDLKACEACKNIKNDVVTIAKGAIFFAEPQNIMKNYPSLDIVVTNEEEQALSKISFATHDWQEINNIVYRKNGDIIINPKCVSTVFELPMPKLDQINHELYRRPDTNEKQATIVVGRGCPGNCIYCIAPMVGGRVARYRDIYQVIAEIKQYYYRYGISSFYFSADTFTWNYRWVEEFCLQLSKLEFKISWVCTARADRITNGLIQKMKRAGCWGVSIGVESGSEYIQKKINKNLRMDCIQKAIAICRRNRIVTLLHFIIGFPWETQKMINETIRLSKKLKGNIIEFYIATPIPGTELYNTIKNDAKLTLSKTTIGLNQKTATTATYYVSAERLEKLCKKAIRSIYFNPLFYINSLLYIHSISQFVGCFIFTCKKIKRIIIASCNRKPISLSNKKNIERRD